MIELSVLKKFVEEEIDPILSLHHGGLEIIEIKDFILTIKLYGSCAGCPSSQISLYSMIEPRIKQKFPEIKEINLQP